MPSGARTLLPTSRVPRPAPARSETQLRCLLRTNLSLPEQMEVCPCFFPRPLDTDSRYSACCSAAATSVLASLLTESCACRAPRHTGGGRGTRQVCGAWAALGEGHTSGPPRDTHLSRRPTRSPCWRQVGMKYLLPHLYGSKAQVSTSWTFH